MSDTEFPGHVLRTRREALGLVPADLYARIHMPAAYALALEDGRLDALPAPAYTLGFLATYCTYLGLDPEPFLDAYRACTLPLNRPEPRRGWRALTPFHFRPIWWNDAMTWGTLCLVFLLAWAAYAVIVGPVVATDPAETLQADTVPAAAPVHFEEDF